MPVGEAVDALVVPERHEEDEERVGDEGVAPVEDEAVGEDVTGVQVVMLQRQRERIGLEAFDERAERRETGRLEARERPRHVE